MKALPAPEPIAVASAGTSLAALLWPAPAEAPGVVVVHGHLSRKENHADFAEACAAAGMAALAIDLRGHGGSAGAPDAGMLDDVLAGLATLRGRGHTRLGLRGSSLGGFLALNAAARDRAVRAVVAICPAPAAGLARRLGASWPLSLPLEAAVTAAGRVARGYWHAAGDEQVPWASTAALARVTPEPTRVRILPGGGHRTLQHDPAVLLETLAFLRGHLRA